MAAYYNEIDPYCVERDQNELDVQQSNDGSLRELALFAGAGGGILGGKLLGWRTVCAVERDAYAAAILAQRQNDGLLPPFPVWSDIETFDGRPWCGIVDVVSGGFPCQDISAAGKGKGIDGERSGLWKEMYRIICDVQPRYAFIENSPMLASRGLDRLLCDLAKIGFNAEWEVIPASSVGAPSRRERMWIVAHADSDRPQRINTISGSEEAQKGEWAHIKGVVIQIQQGKRDCIPESYISRKSDGIPFRVDITKAIGNAQVPYCAATAWRILTS